MAMAGSGLGELLPSWEIASEGSELSTSLPAFSCCLGKGDPGSEQHLALWLCLSLGCRGPQAAQQEWESGGGGGCIEEDVSGCPTPYDPSRWHTCQEEAGSGLKKSSPDIMGRRVGRM